jgi:hypothetical protein
MMQSLALGYLEMEIHKAMFQTTNQIWVCLKMGNWTHGEKSD